MKGGTGLSLIVLGYGLAVATGIAAVMFNEHVTPAEVSQSSGGMVAFSDMILFVLAAGLVALLPSWFVLKALAARAPLLLPGAIVLIAATGPLSWLAVMAPGGAGGPATWLATLTVFLALPRIALGPAVLLLEAAALLLCRGRAARCVVLAAMLTEIVPLAWFALHMVRAAHG